MANSSSSGNSSAGKPTAAAMWRSMMTTATSASNACAARSAAPTTAAASSGSDDTTASSSTSCWICSAATASTISGEGQDNQGLVVEPVDTAHPGDLAVGVEAGERYPGRGLLQVRPLLADALVAEDRPQRGAAEREHADRLPAVQRLAHVPARGVGGRQDRLLVALHDPGQPAEVDRAATADGAARQVDLGADVARLDTAAPLHADRAGQGEVDERVDVGVRVGRGAEALQVHVEGGTVVEGQHPAVLAAGHDHRRTQPAPAVPHRDRERRVRLDHHGGDRVGEDLAVGHDVGTRHPTAVGGRAAEERDAGTEYRVAAAQDGLLVADHAVGEHEQGTVRATVGAVHRTGQLDAGLPLAAGHLLHDRAGDGEAGTADDRDRDRTVERTARPDLAVRGAAEYRYLADTLLHRGRVVGDGREDEYQ